MTVYKGTPILEHVKDIGFVSDSSDKACQCMVYIPGESVVLVGYGNTIGVIDTQTHTVRKDQFCSVPGQTGLFLKEIVYSKGFIFGIFNCSFDLVLFSLKPFEYIDALRCDNTLSHVEETETIDGERGRVARNSRYTLRDRLVNSGNVERQKSRLRAASNHRTAEVQIECLLVTEDILWVGRSNGDVLLLKYSATNDGLTGEVLATLNPKPAYIGLQEVDVAPVVHLRKTKTNKIVMCKKVCGKDEEGFQVFVWENFGIEDRKHFERYIDIHS